MSTINTGDQQIVWKYRTPLQGQYLGTLLAHSSNEGLCTIPTVTVSGTGVTISAFSALLRPSDFSGYIGDKDTLVKLTTRDSSILTWILDEATTTVAIGISYDFQNNGSNAAAWYAEFHKLNATQAMTFKTDNPGSMILCYVYNNGQSVSCTGGDWSDYYIRELGWNVNQWLAPTHISRTGGAVPLQTVEVRSHNNQKTDPLLAPGQGVDNDRNSLLVVPTNQIDISEAADGSFLALGYPASSPTVLSILDSQTTQAALRIPLNATLVGVMQKNTNALLSTYVNAFSAGVGSPSQPYQTIPYTYVVETQADMDAMLGDSNPGLKYRAVYIKSMGNTGYDIGTWTLSSTQTLYVVGSGCDFVTGSHAGTLLYGNIVGTNVRCTLEHLIVSNNTAGSTVAVTDIPYMSNVILYVTGSAGNADYKPNISGQMCLRTDCYSSTSGSGVMNELRDVNFTNVNVTSTVSVHGQSDSTGFSYTNSKLAQLYSLISTNPSAYPTVGKPVSGIDIPINVNGTIGYLKPACTTCQTCNQCLMGYSDSCQLCQSNY